MNSSTLVHGVSPSLSKKNVPLSGRNVTPRSERKTTASTMEREKPRLKNEKDVFSRLTQGLPTRHTAPSNLKRSQSTGKLSVKSRSPGRSRSRERNPQLTPRSENLSSKNSYRREDQSKNLVRELNFEKELRMERSSTLVSHLLLPSPPRNFISCIPEPLPMERNSGGQALQHLREIIQKESFVTYGLFA
jgi:hypothetical protein